MPETSGTWTDADHLGVAVYRGAHGLPGGSPNIDVGSSNTVYYGAVTPTTYPAALGTGWYVACCAHQAATDTGTAPVGMGNRATGGTYVAVHDTGGPISTNWPTTAVSLNATGKYATWVSQVAANGTVSRIGADAANGTTIAIPAGHQVGDFIIIFAVRYATGGPTMPAGWTNIGSTSWIGGVTATGGWRIATSSDTAFVPRISVY